MSDALYLGIDMGGTNIRVAVMDTGGAVLRSQSTPLPRETRARAALPAELAHAYRDVVGGVGLAVAGTVANGVLTWSANLGLADIDFSERLRAATGLPVAVLNDARAAGYAEALVGAGAGAGTVLSVTVGTGIGGALIADGSLIVGTGDAGEIGHMVIDPDGPVCTCGRRGCWERYVGGRALAERAAAMYPDETEPLKRLLRDGADPTSPAGTYLCATADLFSLGLDNLHAVFAPDVVVLGGGVMARDGEIARRYRAAAERTRWGARARVRSSLLGDEAGLIGASLAAAHVSQE